MQGLLELLFPFSGVSALSQLLSAYLVLRVSEVGRGEGSCYVLSKLNVGNFLQGKGYSYWVEGTERKPLYI